MRRIVQSVWIASLYPQDSKVRASLAAESQQETQP